MSVIEPRPPCLQALVAAFGTYGAIPDAAWREFDAATAQWHRDRIAAMGLAPISPEEAKERKRRRRREEEARREWRQNHYKT